MAIKPEENEFSVTIPHDERQGYINNLVRAALRACVAAQNENAGTYALPALHFQRVSVWRMSGRAWRGLHACCNAACSCLGKPGAGCTRALQRCWFMSGQARRGLHACAATLLSPAAARGPADRVRRTQAELHRFQFNGIFDDTTTQERVFDTVGRRVLNSLLDGYNSTVFAYGQTGSGKTFTITGGVERCGHPVAARCGLRVRGGLVSTLAGFASSGGDARHRGCALLRSRAPAFRRAAPR